MAEWGVGEVGWAGGGGVLLIIYTGRRCPKWYLVSIQDRLFRVIFNF